MITVEHLTKYYGDHLAVNDLSFEINEGHVYGFLGPNGAGKSTTMNIMTGCLSATAGSVRIDGYDIFEEPEKVKRLIGYLPEQPPLYMNESPLDYLRFVGEAKGLRGAALNGQIQEVICQTGIAPVAHRRISDLSKGYKQRVGIAQALLGNPRVIILDEPTVGLDPIQIIEIRDLIRTLGENHTVIFSSHILSEVQTICDQILMIAHGKLVAFGPPDELEKQFSAAGELEITADADLQELRRVLSTVELLSEITTTVLPSGYGKASVKSAHRDLYAVSGAVFRACADAGVTLLEMRLKKANLEDVFLELASAGEEPSAGAAGAREQPSEDAGEGEVPEK